MKTFFAPISKINKKTREVEGYIAEEVKDQEGEIMDFTSSAPLFEQWSEEIKKVSGGKSVGNVRVMHQPIVGGKLTELSLLDDVKKVKAVAKVSNDKAWNQILNGELNGFSISGEYKKRWKDPVSKARRYTVKPFEVSLVDNPCMYGATFTEVREDGEVVTSKFVGRKEPQQVFLCTKECDIFHSSKKEAEECGGNKVSKIVADKDEEIDIEDEDNNDEKVVKGMYDISALASDISSLKWINTGDNELQKKFGKAISSLFSVLQNMVKVEKTNFEESMTALETQVATVKAVGLEILEGDNIMDEKKVKKAASEIDVEELTENILIEVDERLEKSVGSISKKMAKSIGVVIKDALEEALSEIQGDMNLLKDTVIKMSGLPKKSKVVTKVVDTRRGKKLSQTDDDDSDDDDSDDDSEKPEKVAKKFTDREDPALVRLMKKDLSRGYVSKAALSGIDDNADDDNDDNDEDTD
jgi:hypothetical protein